VKEVCENYLFFKIKEAIRDSSAFRSSINIFFKHFPFDTEPQYWELNKTGQTGESSVSEYCFSPRSV